MKCSFLSAAMLFSAFFIFQDMILSQDKAVSGEGPVINKNIDVEKVTGVGLGLPAQVILSQGNTQSITIKGQQNIIDLIEYKVKGNSINFEWKKSYYAKNYEKVEIHLTLAEVSSLAIGGSGSITGQGTIKTNDRLSLAIGGSGNISLKVDGKQVAAAIGGSGSITLEGNANSMDVSVGGSGDVNAEGLKVNDCKVSSAGSGDAEVWAIEQLTISLAGSGDVLYKGDPKVSKTSVGSGSVKKI